MKNLIKTIILLFFIIIGKNTKAQVCEFETVGQIGTRADQIMQLNDKSIIIAGRKGYGKSGQSWLGPAFKQSIYLRKIDTCNNFIWEVNLDSGYSYRDLYGPFTIKIVDNLILITHYLSDTLKEFKIDYQGNIISRKIFKFPAIGNAYFASKISEDKYLFLGTNSIDINNNYVNGVITDTTQNFVWPFKFNFYKNTPRPWQFKKISNNKISLIYSYKFSNQNSDSSIKIINIDTLANIIDTVQLNFNNPFPQAMFYNETNDGFITYGKKYITDSLNNIINTKYYLGNCSLQGDINTNFISNTYIQYYGFFNKQFLCRTNNFLVLDSSFSLINSLKDTLLDPIFNTSYIGVYYSKSNTILSVDNQIYRSGYIGQSNGSTVYPTYNEWIKKSSIFKYIKTINIAGNGTINTKGGFTQLIANVTPTDATNKQILWSISDTNLATITQTGLVTAKANGTVIVTTKTNDGSNLIATKTIIISNQNTLVLQISIIGNDSIFTKNGSLQLSTQVLPTNATNKQILWSISDTNIATITQTGLVTANANGTVIVTATAADGGGAKATKTITISNQNVGINEVKLSSQIVVYPNPASNVLTINQLNENFSYKIINLQGQEILNGEPKKPFSNIDISKLEAGSYIIGLTTETGIYWKKFVKN